MNDVLRNVGLAVVAMTIGAFIANHVIDPNPPKPSSTVIVRDRSDSIRIAIQAVIIANLDANLRFERRKRDTIAALGHSKERTIRLLQSLIDSLRSVDSTRDSVSIPSFVADTVTTKGDTVHAEFAFEPRPSFGLRFGFAPRDTFFVAHDSLVTVSAPTTSVAKLGIGVAGGISVGVGIAKDNSSAVTAGGLVLVGLTIYELLK